jgi:hypothetical protein
MAKNRAKDVSLVTFGEKFFEVYNKGGTIIDLQNAVEMENLGSVRQKLVALKKQFRENGFGELPSLKHSGRSVNKGETVGQTAANRLAALFAMKNGGESNESTDETTESETVSATEGDGIRKLSEVVHDLAAKATSFTETASQAESLVSELTHQNA